jgi:hypothetical protein
VCGEERLVGSKVLVLGWREEGIEGGGVAEGGGVLGKDVKGVGIDLDKY